MCLSKATFRRKFSDVSYTLLQIFTLGSQLSQTEFYSIFGESFRFCSNRVIKPNNGINTAVPVLIL